MDNIQHEYSPINAISSPIFNRAALEQELTLQEITSMPIVLDPDTRAEMQTMLDNPATSYWLRDALKSALRRDCVDAVHDAEILVTLLRKRCDAVLEQHGATLLPLSRNKPS